VFVSQTDKKINLHVCQKKKEIPKIKPKFKKIVLALQSSLDHGPLR